MSYEIINMHLFIITATYNLNSLADRRRRILNNYIKVLKQY